MTCKKAVDSSYISGLLCLAVGNADSNGLKKHFSSTKMQKDHHFVPFCSGFEMVDTDAELHDN